MLWPSTGMYLDLPPKHRVEEHQESDGHQDAEDDRARAARSRRRGCTAPAAGTVGRISRALPRHVEEDVVERRAHDVEPVEFDAVALDVLEQSQQVAAARRSIVAETTSPIDTKLDAGVA